ncbi:MAG: rRNA maturation RNase YbeY [Gammaproteobacteria bacterium]
MRVNVQIATALDDTPEPEKITEWAKLALQRCSSETEVTIRVVGLEEGRQLNEQWRASSGATNVLAFPIDRLEVTPSLLGDVVVCASVANAEVRQGGKSMDEHWAHLVIHGTLHLLGYDHLNEIDATEMEGLERSLLRDLSYPDPYL